MAEGSGDTWTGPETGHAADERLLSLEQQLALVDRVKSLEAQLAQSAPRPLTPTETLDAEQQLFDLRRSATWRVGRVVLLPARVIRRAVGRAGKA